MFKPRADMTIYATFADSIQAPDVAAASSGTTIIVNASQALPPYRSKQQEIGYKLRFRSINFSAGVFRLERPFANFVTGVTNPVCGAQSGTPNCEVFQITGRQLNYGAEAMLSGRVFERLMLTGGLTALRPRLTDTGIAVTNNRNFVGMPDYKSNILAEYRIQGFTGVFLNFDWQHVGQRPIDDINSVYTPQYNVFDFGVAIHDSPLRNSNDLAHHAQQRDRCALLVDARSRKHHRAEHRKLSRTPWRAAAGHGFHAIRLLEEPAC